MIGSIFREPADATLPGTVNIDHFGARNDFAGALEAAVAVAAPTGAAIVGTPGKLYRSRRQVLFVDTPLNIDLSMSTVERSADFATHASALIGNPYSAAPVVRAEYSHGTPIAATGPLQFADIDFSVAEAGGATEGLTTVTRIPLASVAGLAAGDYLHIYADNPISWSVPADNEYVGQDAQIAVVNADSVDLYGILDLHQHMTVTVRVARLTDLPCRLSIDARDPAGWADNPVGNIQLRRNIPLVQVIGAVRPDFPSMRFRDVCGTGLETIACYNPVVDKLDCENHRMSSTHKVYGYGWVTSCTYPRLQRPLNARRVRHLITSRAVSHNALTAHLANPALPYPNDAPATYGGSVRGLINCGLIRGGRHAPFDTHSDAYCWTFVGGKIGGAVRGVSAGQYSINARGHGHRFLDIDTDSVGAISIIPQGTGTDFYYRGAHHRRAGYSTGVPVISVADNGQAFKPKVTIELALKIDGGSFVPMVFNNADVTFRGSVDWGYEGASVAKLFSLTKTDLDAEFTVDFSRATGTGARLVRMEDALSSARLIVRGKAQAAGNIVVCDFVNNSGSLCFADLRLTQGALSATPFTNLGARSIYNLKQRERTVTAANWTSAGNKTVTWTNLWSEVTYLSAMATVTGVALNSVPKPTVPGELLVIQNNKAGGIEPFTVNYVAGLLEIGSNQAVPLTGILRLIGDPVAGTWSLQP